MFIYFQLFHYTLQIQIFPLPSRPFNIKKYVDLLTNIFWIIFFNLNTADSGLVEPVPCRVIDHRQNPTYLILTHHRGKSKE